MLKIDGWQNKPSKSAKESRKESRKKENNTL